MADENLQEKLKNHIRFEEGMDDSLLPFYIESATKYVTKKVGEPVDYLIIMTATVMYDNRSAGDELSAALQALEPIFALEVLASGEEQGSDDKQP